MLLLTAHLLASSHAAGMELRIGVVAHNLVSLSLAGKQAALQDAAKRGGGGPGGTSVRDAGPGSRAQQLRSK
jgi:hypothetical protein